MHLLFSEGASLARVAASLKYFCLKPTNCVIFI